MFKSIFSKYVSAFMTIILISFVMLIVITTVMIGNYSDSVREDTLIRAAESASEYLGGQMGSYGDLHLEEGSRLRNFVYSGGDSLKRTMKVIAEYSDDLTVMIADPAGQIIMVIDSDSARFPNSMSISVEDMSAFNSGDEVDLLHGVDGLFDDTRTATARAILYGNEHVGSVFVCTSPSEMPLQQVIIKTIVLASIWVMLAALITVYLITERITRPLGKISAAVKRFADGDYAVRIPARGSTEIADLARAFNGMADSIEASEKMRNTFMANVSHDLRTPMTTISGFIDSILCGAIKPEEQEKYLSLIASETRRLSRLVAELLDLSRLQAGDRKFNMQPFDVCEMSRQILISFEQKIDGKHLDVVFDCDEDNMIAVADRDAIYQVLYNICDNAVKFSREGGRLELKITYEGEKLRISTYDEGEGIAEDDLPYVFERFYKADKSRGLDKTGVGLGMFITKTIMDAHHETIAVESEANKYCRFHFTLARAKEQKQ